MSEQDPARVLAGVVEHYLGSPYFNGSPVRPHDPRASALESLLADGLIEVVASRYFDDPHIKPWSPLDSWDQGAALADAVSGSVLACVYPSTRAMEQVDLSHLNSTPYTQALAEGHGQLGVVFFDMAAMEEYRNDPRYDFQIHDYGVSWGISTEAYHARDEPERDKIATVDAGFAFPREDLEAGHTPRRRALCVSLQRLHTLTPAHQQRLATWEATDQDTLVPHPLWWSAQMGAWVPEIGLFEKVLGEIRALSEVWEASYGAPLFRSVDRPRAWGWLLRPSTGEWDQFVMLTNQLLADNLNSAALDAAKAPKRHGDGNPLGSLKRLEVLLEEAGLPAESVAEVMEPLHRVRLARQKPAHQAEPPKTDHAVFDRQRHLLIDLADSLQALREWVQSHVGALNWRAPASLDRWFAL